MDKILLIEDSSEYQMLVEETLRAEYDIRTAGGVALALSEIEKTEFDLFIIDVGLPDGDGFQVCEKIKTNPKTSDVPVIFLTGQNETDKKVHGFSIGADDYVVKPFDPRELKARVSARLRAAKQAASGSNTLEAGGIRVDLIRQKTMISMNQKTTEVDLSPIELRLLISLLSREGQVLTRGELLKEAMHQEFCDHPYVNYDDDTEYYDAVRSTFEFMSHLINPA
ncbi:MAG: response regulator transcription factor [Proteobacteria bacterium]|nr:MAG: response regulator transcription factor [Pseudomonadota bacterium]